MTCMVDGYIVDLISVIYDVRSTRLSLTLPGHSRRSSAQSSHGITCRGSGRDRCEWFDLRVQSCWAGRKRRLVTVPPRCTWTVILRSSSERGSNRGICNLPGQILSSRGICNLSGQILSSVDSDFRLNTYVSACCENGSQRDRNDVGAERPRSEAGEARSSFWR